MSLFSDKQLVGMKSSTAGSGIQFDKLDKCKKSFIDDFLKGKLQTFDVVMSNGKTLNLNPMELNIFGVTPTWTWEDIYGMVSGTKQAKDMVSTYLNDQALKYAFEEGNLSSISNSVMDNVNMYLYENNLQDSVVVVSVNYGNTVLYVNKNISGN